MKHIKKYLNQLKSCLTEEEVWDLMKGRVFPGSDNSRFEEDMIQLPTSTGYYSGVSINVDNKLLDLACRVILFLKLDGEISNLPRNSGKKTYASHIRYFLSNMSDLHNNILSLDDLNGNDMDFLINQHKNNSKELVSTTLCAKLGRLEEWIIFANHKLPLFLQLNETLFLNSKHYMEFYEQCRQRKRETAMIGGPKEPYPLNKLKYLVKEAMLYLEEYSQDCLYAAKIYIETKSFKSLSEKYNHVLNYFKTVAHKFTEPALLGLQKKCQESDSAFIDVNGKQQRSVRMGDGLVEECISAAKRLEGACVTIILMLTAMRRQELARLERHPVIEEGEYLNFKRFIYKTAHTENGDLLEIPIPPIVQSALESLSRISEIKDGKTTGPIIVSDFRFSEGCNDNRVQASIRYFSKSINLENPPTPHQLRHAMAFLVAFLNEKDGLELARLLLGHDTILMTLWYMGHYSPLIKEVVSEQLIKKSKQLVDVIGKELNSGKLLFGPKGKLIMENYEFSGSYVEEFSSILSETMITLIEKGQAVLIQNPICFCFHDMSKGTEMSCQRGLGMSDLTGALPLPSRCNGYDCESAIFTEEYIQRLDNTMIDSELEKRLLGNTYFVDFGGFDAIDPSRSIVNDYIMTKQRMG
ncbi:site-specific integrase [Sulfurovum sp. XGS-02]|uniref:site-specific integrase n=1 Tax=Sulfurovum sp. XGS-02 TaxID=2925411 RepID=UPI00204D5E6F|nr:site-specific integrase [Sulfurovum sp. XGS-02]UPT78165.1 site-specific integrase [Sulfurovum sp. XGS-02]